MSRRYAFVVPRFSERVHGGAETLVGLLASKLAQRGDVVEVLTTCALDNRTWVNELPEGIAQEYGVTVRRFIVDNRDLEQWIPIQIAISQGMRPSVDDQLRWMTHSVNSKGLYEYIAQHSSQYDALFFAPYLFGTTFWGSMIDPARSFLIPCLHDESYAYLDIIGSMFRQVRGCLFNALPERDLARALYGDIQGGEVAMGFEPAQDLPSLTPYFEEKFPYLLYCGRKETGKNAHLLVDYFIEGKERGVIDPEMRLVVLGGGSFDDLERPHAKLRGDIVDLSELSEEEKRSLMHHARALCQLSVNESFSIVIMEAWLLGTPVIVHAQCAVTRHHVLQSGGGLYAGSAAEFFESVREISADSRQRAAFAAAGREYVQQRYSWEAVLQRFDQVVQNLNSDRPHL